MLRHEVTKLRLYTLGVMLQPRKSEQNETCNYKKSYLYHMDEDAGTVQYFSLYLQQCYGTV